MELIGTRIILQDDDATANVVFEFAIINGQLHLVCLSDKVKMPLNCPESSNPAVAAYQTALWTIARYLGAVGQAMAREGDSLN